MHYFKKFFNFSSVFCLLMVLIFGSLARATTTPPMLIPSKNLEGVMPFDGLVYGREKAPVRVEIYASLTCPHCGAFQAYVFPKLQKKYLNEGRIALVMHSFVSDQVSLTGTVVVRCFSPDKQRDFFEILLQKQDIWAFDMRYRERLFQIAQLAGMDAARFEACLGNQTLIDRSVASTMEATKRYAIKGIPVVLIDGKIYEGGVDEAMLSEAIERALEARKS